MKRALGMLAAALLAAAMLSGCSGSAPKPNHGAGRGLRLAKRHDHPR